MAGTASIERLYGVQHSAEGLFGEKLVKPSRELLYDILSQPPGTKIAIEYNPNLKNPIPIKGRKPAIISDGSRYYWEWLLRVAQRAKLDVHFLEDPALYAKIFSKQTESEKIGKRIQSRRVDMPLQTFLDLSRARHKAQIEAQYAFHVEREDEMLRRIAQTEPAIVIVGLAHGETFVHEIEKIRDKGIDIKDYATEMVYQQYSVSPRGKMRWGEQIDPSYSLSRKSLERKYKAVTEGRVIDEAPDFIGTWDRRVPAQGLFEIFLQSGTIEDVLGTADITGVFTENRLVFNKVYDPERCAPEALASRLHYETVRDKDEKFTGEWGVGGWGGGFAVIMPFKPGIDINKELGINV